MNINQLVKDIKNPYKLPNIIKTLWCKVHYLEENTNPAIVVPHNSLTGLQGVGPQYIHLNQSEYDYLFEIDYIPLSGTINPITGNLLGVSLLPGKTSFHFAQIGDINQSINLLGLQEVSNINSTTTNKLYLNGGAETITAVLSNDIVPFGQLNSLLNNKADLVGGLVPASQLPASLDDVLNGVYISSTIFNDPLGVPYIPMSNAIYIDTTTDITYRWSGTNYVAIGNSLALGITSSTAYRGDYGNIAYLHSQITSGNPHNVTKAQVGLGNVDNTSDINKPVSILQQSAIDSVQKDSKFIRVNSNYTLQQADSGKYILISGNSRTITIPNGLTGEFHITLDIEGTGALIIDDTTTMYGDNTGLNNGTGIGNNYNVPQNGSFYFIRNTVDGRIRTKGDYI